MELTFLGGASEIGASCTLLHIAGHSILIDGGMRPAAREGQSRLPDLTVLDRFPPEALLITHAHIDHTGALPLIASLFPHMPIYATESTRMLTEVLLRDSIRIMEQEHLRPDGETPLYTTEQVDMLLGRIQAIGFRQPFVPVPALPHLTTHYLPAGHILGAAMLFFDTPEGTLLHTGDISVTDQRTVKGLDIESIPQADVMICEGTYGNRSHTNRKDEERKLAETVQAVLVRGGRILCPAFAVGRAQEIVLILKSYRASGQISPIPIYLDGMVRSVCTVYQNQSHDLQPGLQRYLTNARRPLFADPDLHIFSVRAHERAALITHKDPMVVISSSGMLTGGVSPLYASDIAVREQDCILFTGYQDEESPGAALLAARQGDQLRLGNRSITLNCQVARYNLSGHADAQQIQGVVTKVHPTQLILVHGAPEALSALSQRFQHLHIDIPRVGTTITVRARQAMHSLAIERSDDSLVPSLQASDQRNDAVNRATPRVPTPTLQDLWLLASERGPNRPWTSVELGQHYYDAYKPALRPVIEAVLREATPYFKMRRLGAQATYLPRSLEEVEQLRPVAQSTAGEIVLVQGINGTPQLGLLLSSPQEGVVSLIADQWKQGMRPINVIQLRPNIRRDEWLTNPLQEIKQHLQSWRRQLDDEWVDLLACWDNCKEQPFTFAALCEQYAENQRLAWGLELLARGSQLFRRDGMSWTPLPGERILKDVGLAHHIELVRAGADALVQVNEQRAMLTGRSNWRLFEVRWDEGAVAGQLGCVKGQNIRLVSQQESD